jgi:Recombination endonuclease VII
VTDEAWTAEPVVDVPESKRKRRRYRRYPRPECSPAQRAALLELQQEKCAICGAEGELFTDHSYRSGKTQGLLCRQHNAALGMFKDSPTLLKRALAYLKEPPAKKLGIGDTEVEREGR